MKKTPRTAVSTLLATLALAAAVLGVSLLPRPQAETAAAAPERVAQSTSAILENRAA